MAYDLWGESPLYENEGLKEGSIPAGVTGNPLGLAGEWRWMVVAEEGAVGVERGL